MLKLSNQEYAYVMELMYNLKRCIELYPNGNNPFDVFGITCDIMTGNNILNTLISYMDSKKAESEQNACQQASVSVRERVDHWNDMIKRLQTEGE